MFIKRLRILEGERVIREVVFHKGLNLIVDETSDGNYDTGNNVGKTTVLRLIDMCLGGDEKRVYSKVEAETGSYDLVKNFLYDNEILVELMLAESLTEESKTVVLRRNFSVKRNRKVYEINGVRYTQKLYNEALSEKIFGAKRDKKPSFRQIISRNIRIDDERLSNTLQVLGKFTSLSEYSAYFLYLFGCDNSMLLSISDLEMLLNKELSYYKHLCERLSKKENEALLKEANLRLELLMKEQQKLFESKAIIELTQKIEIVKSDILDKIERQNDLRLKLNLIKDAIEDLKNRKFEIDVEEIRQLYSLAKIYVPELHRTFEELLSFHEQMLSNKQSFLQADIPLHQAWIDTLNDEIIELKCTEERYNAQMQEFLASQDWNALISEISALKTDIATYTTRIELIESSEVEQNNLKIKIEELRNSGGALSTLDRLTENVNKFNKIFDDITQRLYNEHNSLIVKEEEDGKGGVNYKLSLSANNVSAGKVQGEMLCFDLAYAIFSQMEGIPSLQFLLNDKKELMHGNQLAQLPEILKDKPVQLIAAILRDKLPVEILNQIEAFTILSLSQNDKLFKI